MVTFAFEDLQRYIYIFIQERNSYLQDLQEALSLRGSYSQ